MTRPTPPTPWPSACFSGDYHSVALVDTPLGSIGIRVEDGRLCGLELEPDRTTWAKDAPPTLIREQLRAYFEDAGHHFELPLHLRGTAFQRRVWAALREIPSGCTVTYGALAHRLGTGARAIGGGVPRQPLPNRRALPSRRCRQGTRRLCRRYRRSKARDQAVAPAARGGGASGNAEGLVATVMVAQRPRHPAAIGIVNLLKVDGWWPPTTDRRSLTFR